MYDESIEDPDAEALERHHDHDLTCSDSESDIESDED